MERDPFFSIVMPVYNTEKYLGKASQSVLTQTFEDFELILVDDCSTDFSGKICDHLATEDDRISVIHLPQNAGLSNARNMGLQSATGKYILFMDSDDYVDDYLFLKVYQSIQKNRAPVVLFGLIEEYYDKRQKIYSSKKIYMPEMLFSDQDSLRRQVILLEEKTLYGYAWNKFYDLKFLKDRKLLFENVRFIEDITFNVNFFMDIDRLNILGITPYHYCKRFENSLTSKFIPDYFQLNSARIQLVLNQYICWNLCDDRVLNILANIYGRYVLSALQRNCDGRAAMNHSGRRKWMQALYGSDLYSLLIEHVDSKSRIITFCSQLLKKRKTFLCLVAGRTVFVVKCKLPVLFNRIQRR